MTEKTFRFTFRSVVALMLLLCLIALPITAIGIVASEGPELANVQVNFEEGAGEIWSAIHVTFGILLVISGLCHAVLNRRQLVNHIKGAIGR